MWGALESMRLFPELDHTNLLELPPDFQALIGLAGGYPMKEISENDKTHNAMGVNYIN